MPSSEPSRIDRLHAQADETYERLERVKGQIDALVQGPSPSGGDIVNGADYARLLGEALAAHKQAAAVLRQLARVYRHAGRLQDAARYRHAAEQVKGSIARTAAERRSVLEALGV